MLRARRARRVNDAPIRRPVVVLISGRGSNMRALIEHSRTADAPYEVRCVISDNPAAAGLDAARDLGIAALAVPPQGAARASYDRRLAEVIAQHSPALIVLAGFMRILSPEFVAAFGGRILNIHPSLLPKHPGLHTHRRVIEAGDAEHGATVHFVTAELDQGPRIIQGKIPVDAGDSETTLAARVQVQEHRIYPLAVRWFCEGRLRHEAGRAWFDGRPLTAPVQYSQIAEAGSA
jgi:phosphoribosylglycinamide formyltransferase-1